MRLSLAVLCGFLITMAITPPCARAQQASADTSARKKSVETDTARLSAARVTVQRLTRSYWAPQSTAATRTDLPLRDLPRTVSVVTRQLIADQSMQSMADVARYVPGVSMASGEGHRDAPTIRGNSTTADFFVDGARDDAQYLRDLYNAERVEVLKGPEALLFGRGGGGGVINRVTRRADWSPVGMITTEGGSFDHKRLTLDAGQGLGSNLAARLNSVYEHSGGFRDAANLTRYGVNPTVAIMPGPRTIVHASYEFFDDARRVDRGVPSYQGRPLPGDITTFFGNPSVNHAESRVNLASASVEHRTEGGVTLRNRTTWADYDKFYQNTLPGAVNAAGTRVTLSAYNHAILRQNLLNVSDATFALSTGAVRHVVLTGVDVARQRTGQVRRTGYYNDTTASYSAPLSDPTVSTPVTFRQSTADADNTTVAHAAAAYVQDQITLSPAWLVVAGIRYERFAVSYHNSRTRLDLDRVDHLIAPRAGVVFKAAPSLSVYTSVGVSHLPSAGDQFTSLSVTTATLEPERFTNREFGVKWDVRPEFSVTTAVYRVDRTNAAAPDPVNSGLTVQTGAQRTTGWELGATGSPTSAWQLAGGIGSQNARIVSTTSAAKSGAQVALVPRSTLSLWNRYQVLPSFGMGLGVTHQSAMYAAIDNTVTLPGFTRVDAAAYVTLNRSVRAQVNVENLLNARYFATTQGNNNIMPGTPRHLRMSVVVSR